MRLHAQPYSYEGVGFYFSTYDEYEEKRKQTMIEEFEIQFIDGSVEELILFQTLKVDQCRLKEFMEFLDENCLTYDEVCAIEFLEGYRSGDELWSSLNNQEYEEVCIFHGNYEKVGIELADQNGLTEKLQDMGIEAYFDHAFYARDKEINGDIYEIRDEVWVMNANAFNGSNN